tara:strand:- start:713 stop:1507 length:795 start_codon:yes stop_codon:yes gene_type:complete
MKTIIEKKVEDAVDKTFMEKREKIEKYYKEKYPNDFKSKFKKLYDMDYTSLQKEFNRLKNQLEESNIKGNKMKRSELTEFIKEEIISVLSESTEEEVEKTKELTAATKELAKAKEEAGISEDMDGGKLKYPEEGEVVFYEGEPHEVMRIVRHNDGQGPRIYIRPKEESAILGKLDTFWVRPGDIEGTDLREENKEMTDAEKDKAATKGAKKEPIGKLATKMAENNKEMKSVLSKYKKAEGEEKEKQLARLKELTKIKKELEKML